MTDEELADFLQSIQVKGYIDKSISTKTEDALHDSVMTWLKSRVEE